MTRFKYIVLIYAAAWLCFSMLVVMLFGGNGWGG